MYTNLHTGLLARDEGIEPPPVCIESINAGHDDKVAVAGTSTPLLEMLVNISFLAADILVISLAILMTTS